MSGLGESYRATGAASGTVITPTNWTVIGAVSGIVLAFAILMFGFWGFLLVALLGLVGGVIGAAVSGRLDLRAAFTAARGGRRVG